MAHLTQFLPSALVLPALIGLLWLLSSRDPRRTGRLRRQLVSVGLTLGSVVLFLLLLPIELEAKTGALQVFGGLLSAVVALSATTFVGNGMAGLMLRGVRNFNAGDFIHVGEHFGRVSDRGLVHIEIQTIDRDLTTLPNLYLVTNPVRVVRASGTIVSARLSLGYDVPHQRVACLLTEAAGALGLADPFVEICELRDHAVAYRAGGFLEDVRSLLSVRSNLRAACLDALHLAEIEVLSPAHQSERRLPPSTRIIPTVTQEATPSDGLPEDIIFDKADSAEMREHLVGQQEALTLKLEDLEGRHGEGETALHRYHTYMIEQVKERQARVAELLDELDD